MSKFAAECRKEGMKDTTLAHHLRHIKAALRWAAKLGLMSKAPAIEMPKRAKGQSQARSRAITTEEYERVILAIPKARPHRCGPMGTVRHRVVAVGLRRSEALDLTWDAGRRVLCPPGERRPVFIIRAEGQKSGKAETCPMAPDFGAWLLAVPEAERVGKVFRLIEQGGLPMHEHRVGRIVETNRQGGRRQSGHQDEAEQEDRQGNHGPRVCGLPFLPPWFRFQVGKAGCPLGLEAADAAQLDCNHRGLLCPPGRERRGR